MSVTSTSDISVRPTGIGGGKDPGSGGGGPNSDDREWPPGFSREDAAQPDKYRIGMWVALASILMLFVALTSAYIVRHHPRAMADQMEPWATVDLPSVLWLNTFVLLLSSLTLELGRRALRRDQFSRAKNLISLTTLLGVTFLAGQLLAWRQLVAQGVYVNTSPHSSFFYLLTGLHSIHLLGGIIALAYLTVAVLRLRISFKRRAGMEAAALYWHFMDGVWIWLFLLLYFWR